MKKTHQWRLLILILIILLLGSGVLARLFFLQIFQCEYYTALAEGQHQLFEKLMPQRGEIFMQDLSASRRNNEEKYYPLAINREFHQVYLVPKDVPDDNKVRLAEQLAGLLELEKDAVLQKINKEDDPYEPLKNKLTGEVVQEIKNLDIDGVGLMPETWRYYPNESLASHLVGFVGMSDDSVLGQYGVEGYYEEELRGKFGFLAGEKDTAGYWIPSLSREIEQAEDGSKIILTIDQNIQFKAEKELERIAERLQAEEGTVIIMDAKSGAVWAMANLPNFNPNEYSKVENIDVFLNPAIQEIYEPGSVFKPFTMAAGLENNIVDFSTTYYDTGQVAMRGGIIKNVDGRSYGQQTMLEVLEKSLNTGIVFVQQKLGEDAFKDFLQNFGFNVPTGVDMAGEIGGNIANLFSGREIDLATISFGQGITVTPLGLTAAIGAIANKGNMMKPYVVKKIIKNNGEEIETQPEVLRRSMTEETAERLTKMMVSVVDNGYGKPASVKGYNIAGKTGTAQVPDLEKGGYSDDTIHSFVGFAPAFDPQFVILIKLDKPRDIRFASDSVGPVFKRLAEYLFNYLEIPPQ